MEDLCKKIKISKKTLYQYVDNKGDLIKKILKYRKKQNEKEILENIDIEANAIDNLLKVSMLLKKKTQCFNPNFLFDINKYYPEIVSEHATNERKSSVEKISNNIIKGKKEGLFRQELDELIIAQLHVNNIEYLQKINFFSDEKYSSEMIFGVIFENHIRAIATSKGVKYFEEQIKKLKITE